MSAKTKRESTLKKPKLGDIFEIPVGDRRAYGQFINRHKNPPNDYGELVRVFPGVVSKRPTSFEGFAKQKHLFMAFFALGAAVKRGMVSIVGSDDIPTEYRPFPVFKAYNENFQTGKRTWFLWDGKQYTKLDYLAFEHYDYPIVEAIGFPILVDRIQNGWTPRDVI